jgi:hypothetical protein
MRNKALRYFRCCVGWPQADVDRPGGLRDMADLAQPITFETFSRHVNADDFRSLQEQLGYDIRWQHGGLRLKRDWAVRFYRSILHGRRVYYVEHSCIEYVFGPGSKVSRP